MVKKKGKSKRTTLQDKYRIERRVKETHRKRRKQAKKDAANGVVTHTPKDPGIPNSWPFKQDLLKQIQRQREQQKQLDEEEKERHKKHRRALQEHQAAGGTATTVKQMLQQAQSDQAAFSAKNSNNSPGDSGKTDGTAAAAGQSSRRAYLRELKKVVDTADILLQVLDARDPISSRIHPTMENAILSRADKKMVLVLNKIDLVPKNVIGAWLTTLRRSHPTIAIKGCQMMERTTVSKKTGDDDGDDDATYATSGTSATRSATPVGMEGLLQLLKNYARTGAAGGGKKSKTTIVVGVIGYPNVGKSSIINSLKRTRAVGVSARPGFTTCMQEVVLDRHVRLLDSPGVVFDDDTAVLGNCVDAGAWDDPIPAVQVLLQRCNHESLLMTYNIPSFPAGDVMRFLGLVARSIGRVLKGGVPDKESAARTVLRDWNTGKIPYYTVPPKDAVPEKANDAIVVSSFGKEFDLAQFDESVLKSLDTKGQDDMDFVQLSNEAVEVVAAKDGDAAKAAKDFLNMRDMVDDEDDDDGDAEMKDTEESKAAARSRLAAAEDFDFEQM